MPPSGVRLLVVFIVVQTEILWITSLIIRNFCVHCQPPVELKRREFYAKFGGNFNIPVVY
jgi:hypothetical protein